MPTILVVDDEPSIRRLLRAALERGGYAVLEAPDGPAALRVARESQPALVLLDVALPRMSGLEVCRRLRDDPPTSRTPVLLLSGVSSAEPQKLAQSGASGWLAKPFTPESLLERVGALLGVPARLQAR